MRRSCLAACRRRVCRMCRWYVVGSFCVEVQCGWIGRLWRSLARLAMVMGRLCLFFGGGENPRSADVFCGRREGTDGWCGADRGGKSVGAALSLSRLAFSVSRSRASNEGRTFLATGGCSKQERTNLGKGKNRWALERRDPGGGLVESILRNTQQYYGLWTGRNGRQSTRRTLTQKWTSWAFRALNRALNYSVHQTATCRRLVVGRD